jgi:predicted flap endonuclease-1-like 5' DNA nuclease
MTGTDTGLHWGAPNIIRGDWVAGLPPGNTPRRTIMTAYRIDRIEGIGPSYRAKLEKVGIRNTRHLLDRAGTKRGRVALAAESGIEEKRILDWVNHADLMRLNGVGNQFAELLEATGVDSVKELRHRNAANLAKAMAELNQTKKLTRAVPTAVRIQKWIDAAKATEPAVTH